ncbi:hypothetical protein A2V47_02635 [Candidatus Atribacteria bacterium RBG_19FT_COMBO_35_14]|uniref:Uncharacterized protein n=1 Tax=Candidatus Sediminicultor quintus TaxID=1797291 RepID=A0A1F5A471_9BACT|nr:MAG: hypothetical protein A2V47_02635 [Candidatus Atribacteria bacterium RBG_19FT_COMBO_35_14]
MIPYSLPKDLRTVFKVKDLYVAGLEDDCTRLTYSEILKDKKTSTLTYFMARALSWFKHIYTRPYRPQTNGRWRPSGRSSKMNSSILIHLIL